MQVVKLKAVRASDRFRNRLCVAIEILRMHAGQEVTEELVQMVNDCAEDLKSACEQWRLETR
jgi:hypothetical protein